MADRKITWQDVDEFLAKEYAKDKKMIDAYAVFRQKIHKGKLYADEEGYGRFYPDDGTFSGYEFGFGKNAFNRAFKTLAEAKTCLKQEFIFHYGNKVLSTLNASEIDTIYDILSKYDVSIEKELNRKDYSKQFWG